MEKQLFFNFPIGMIGALLQNPKRHLLDIAYYAVYQRAFNISNGNPDIDAFESACNDFGISFNDVQETMKDAAHVYLYTNREQPFGSIHLSFFWDFFKHVETKTEQEFAELAAYIAARSIVGRKSYGLTNDKMLFSRMCGKTKIEALPKPTKRKGKYSLVNCLRINKYYTRKRMERIRMALVTKYHVTVYSSMGMRGYYLSFVMDLDALVNAVSKQRSTLSDEKKRYREMIKIAEQKPPENGTPKGTP